MKSEELLNALFEADHKARQAEAALLEGSPQELATLFAARATADLTVTGDEAAWRLERLADLCGSVPSAATVDVLVRILGHEAPSVRVAAGEALLELGYERYAELARGIERALDAGNSSTAMEELSWIIAEIGEPSALKLIGRFLAHPKAEVIASAMEALVAMGDPGAIPMLEKFADDKRVVTIEDYEEEMTTTLGDLAEECVDELTPEE